MFFCSTSQLVQYLGIAGSLGRFLGFYSVFGNAVYAYSGVESISIAAAEVKNPRRAIPQAAKRIFVRVMLFYVLSIFFVGMLVPSNDPDLLSGSGTAHSPFVIAASRSGVKVVPSIINAVVLTSAWSAGNSGLLNSSRILFGEKTVLSEIWMCQRTDVIRNRSCSRGTRPEDLPTCEPLGCPLHRGAFHVSVDLPRLHVLVERSIDCLLVAAGKMSSPFYHIDLVC